MYPATTTGSGNNGGIANLLMDFGDAKVFSNEASLANTRFFGLTITNSTGVDQKVYLTPGYMNPVPTRVIRDGNIPYSVGASDLKCAATGSKTVAEMLAWIAKRPVRVQWIQVESTHVQQLSQAIVIQNKNFLDGDPAPEQLVIGSFKSPNYTNDKLLNVKKPNWQFDDDTETTLVIPGAKVGGDPVDVVTTLGIYWGGCFNPSEIPWKLGNAAMAAGIISS